MADAQRGRSVVEEGITGLPTARYIPSAWEREEFRRELRRSGIAEGNIDAATECLPALAARFHPDDAARLLATVVNATGVGPEGYVGATIAVRSLADQLANLSPC